MDQKWFCQVGDQQFGPLLIAQLQRLADRGQLTAGSPVRREDWTSWTTATQVPQLQSHLGRASTATRVTPTAAAAPQPKPRATRIAGSPPQPAAAATPSRPAVSAPPPTATPATPSTAAAVDEPESGLSRAAIASLCGLGAVAAVLLVVVVVLAAQSGDEPADQQRERAENQQSDSKRDDAAPSRSSFTSAIKKASAADSEAAPTRRNKSPLVDRWSKPTSTKVIRNLQDRTPLCRIRVRSVWASDDPINGKADAAPAIAGSGGLPAADEKGVSDDDVLDLDALGVSRKKRVDATGKILDDGAPTQEPPEKQPTSDSSAAPSSGEASAPSAAGASPPRYVVIEVNLENTSSDRELNYRGWNGDGETTAAKDAELYNQDNLPCHFVARSEVPLAGRRQPALVLPGESIHDTVVFELPKDDFQTLRLVLPQQAFGLTGDPLGFEIPRSHVFGLPPASRSTQESSANDSPAN